MEITFGIPTQRKRATTIEKYPDTPVMTMHSRPEGKGSYKFELNKTAIDRLSLNLTGDEHIIFGFGDKRMFIANATNGTFEIDGIRVTKQGTFSNQKAHKYVTNLLDLDTTIDNEFEITIADDVENAYELIRMHGETHHEEESHLFEEVEVEEKQENFNENYF